MEYLELIENFNNCTLDKSFWSHKSHLIVGFYYLLKYKEKTIDILRERIKTYNESQGVINSDNSGYHETITVFWVKTLEKYFSDNTIKEFTNENVDNFLKSYFCYKGYFLEYYSKENIFSVKARLSFVDSDIKNLTNEKISGKKIYLKKTNYHEWINTRNYRYSKEAFEVDPYMPHLSIEDEKKLYEDYISTNYKLVYGIYSLENDELLGYINAFEFSDLDSDTIIPFLYSYNGSKCETGINIFKKENYGKGYGSESYNLFLKFLKNAFNLKNTYIYTNPNNKRAKGLYNKLGFKNNGITDIDGDEFIKMEYVF